jgi:tetratricopeptide (TPR) repeat protein
MTDEHCFISYSHKDADNFGYQLANELEAGNPYIDTWFDKRDILPGETWDEKVPDAIKTCKCFLFVATEKSIDGDSVCADEWDLALRYKKPILILKIQKDVEPPFRLRKRQWIDLSENFKAGMAKLRKAIERLDSPDGQLQILRDRLSDANRDLPEARTDEEKARILDEIDSLNAEIRAKEIANKDPEKAKKQIRKNINAGLENDRQPLNSTGRKQRSKYINPRPGSIPDYFEGRLIETQEIADFLSNDFQRIMTIIGRAGSGKTVLSCRVLRSLEDGKFPNNIGEFKVGGIVYLSEIGDYKINVANIFSGLIQLIEPNKADKIKELYREGTVSIDEKIRALLKALPNLAILLLDNFENLLDNDDNIFDEELNNAIKTILHSDSNFLKVIITTRTLPRQMSMTEPARQYIKHLEEGLPSPFAENVLRKLDKDGRAGLRDANNELLGQVRQATLGYPRALEAFYSIICVDRYSSPEELIAEGIPETVVEKYVGEAFSRLDSKSQKIMQVLAIYNRPVSYAAADFVLQFHALGVNSAQLLERLVSMHFIRRETKRYFLHPADREYALSRIPVGNYDQRIGQGARARVWDQHSLTLRAADYFVEVRKPCDEWKNLDDLTPQLAEFDLRCAAHDYETAAIILSVIDFDYLLLWGHYRLILELHLRLKNKLEAKELILENLYSIGTGYRYLGITNEAIKVFEDGLNNAHLSKDTRWENVFLGSVGIAYSDLGYETKAMEFHIRALESSKINKYRNGEAADLGNIGVCYGVIGQISKAIKYHEEALNINRENENLRGEGSDLSNLGKCYFELGDVQKAIEYFKQALIIRRKIGDKKGEAIDIEKIGYSLATLGEYGEAKDNIEQAILIADEISFQSMQKFGRLRLSYLYLFQNDLINSRATVEAAIQYDVPKYNHNTTVLYGIIDLQQGEKESANDAFIKSIAQADEILAKTSEYYEALDAKGLALCGLALTTGDIHLKDDFHLQAIEAFRAARKIAPHAGIVNSVLRLFDELAKCDTEGILKDVRQAVEGKEPPSRPSPEAGEGE